MLPPIVICPLEIERSAAGRRSRGRAAVACSGPGPGAMSAFLAGLSEADAPRDRLFILFGVAGGMVDGPVCPPIARVVDGMGGEWRPSEVDQDSPTRGASAASRVTLLGVNDVVGDPAAKRALHDRTGAALVDTESHVFAAWASGRGQRWGVIRAVSDGASETLPAELMRWVDGRGRARASRIAMDVIARPALIGVALRVSRRTNEALDAAGSELERLLDSEMVRSKNHP